MSFSKLAGAFALAGAAALTSGCAVSVSPHGRVGLGVGIPGQVYVQPTPYYAPQQRYYAPPPPPAYYGPHRHYRQW